MTEASPVQQEPTGEAAPALESVVADYTESVVPASARRSNFRMLLTFGSMQLVFGAVLVGYNARFQGLTLGKLIGAMAIATVAMTVYCIGSANVGAVVGQTHAVTTRGIFGTLGSALVSLLLVIDGMGFYLFTVLFVITLAQALLGTIAAVSTVTALLAFVMIINNYFGFTGLQRFAQFVAVPIIILWGLYATIKAFTTVSGHALAAVPHVSSPTSLFFVVGAMVGLSTWGNEPDVFRYAKPGRASWWNIPTLAIPYALGAFLFPIMGYMIAAASGKADFSASIKYFATFTLFGLAALMMIVLLVNQWAVQDGNLYIAINGAQNLLARIPRWRRQYTVIGLGLAAAGLTYILPSLTKTFNIVTGIGAITVPVASTIMAVDVFVLPKMFGLRRPLQRVAGWSELAIANWPGIVALLAGTAVGAFTGGLVPGTSGFGKTYIGFPALQAWVTGGAVYLILVAITARGGRARTVLGYSRIEDPAEPAAARAAGPPESGGA
jgi:purine-cytosine permease-like protein